MAGQIEIQAKAVEARIKYIEAALKDFHRQGRVFRTITSLSEALREHIELKNFDKIHAGTFRRNPNFRHLLDNFMNTAKTKNIVIKDSVNTSIELRRLKKQVKQLEVELEVANRECLEMNDNAIKLSSAPDARIETYEEFSNKKLIAELCCSADLIVDLMKMAHGFTFDFESRTVMNDLDQKEVMNSSDFPHFFKYIKKEVADD